MDVSIVIVNYNTKDLLKQCIESVFAKTVDLDFEIIVVDNASSDGSQQMIKDVFPEVILVENLENVGFGRANNIGFDYAKGRNIFLLNSDTVLLNNAVKILSDYLDDNPQTGICGGNLYDEKENPGLSFKRYFPSVLFELNTLLGDILFKIRYGKNSDFNYTNKPLEVAYVIGADMLLRASILNIAGKFDPDFFMYFEETEFSWRIRKAGFSIYSVPSARIIHLESKSFSDNHKKLKLRFHSRSLYYKKTNSWVSRKIINIIYFFTLNSKILGFKIFGNSKRLNFWKQVRLAYQGEKL